MRVHNTGGAGKKIFLRLPYFFLAPREKESGARWILDGDKYDDWLSVVYFLRKAFGTQKRSSNSCNPNCKGQKYYVSLQMMKQKIYITLIGWATILLLSASSMLHHHHLQEACFAIEQCALDGQWNDLHTEHPSEHSGGGTADRCVVESIKTFLTNTRSVQDVQKSIDKQIPLLFVHIPSIYVERFIQSIENLFDEVSSRIFSGFVVVGGLRGPPMV